MTGGFQVFPETLAVPQWTAANQEQPTLVSITD